MIQRFPEHRPGSARSGPCRVAIGWLKELKTRRLGELHHRRSAVGSDADLRLDRRAIRSRPRDGAGLWLQPHPDHHRVERSLTPVGDRTAIDLGTGKTTPNPLFDRERCLIR